MNSKRLLIDPNQVLKHKFPEVLRHYQLGWNDALDAVFENAPRIDAVETDALADKMYTFYQAVVARTDISAVYVDGVYDLMDYIARWLDELDGERRTGDG